MSATSRRLLVKCLLAAGLTFSWSIANAGDADKFSKMGGVGIRSCAQMTTDVIKHPQGAEVYTSFIDGFAAAINAAVPGKADYLEGTDGSSWYKFVLKYCENNPVDKVYKAIDALYVKVAGSSITDLAKPPTPCPPAVNGKKKVK